MDNFEENEIKIANYLDDKMNADEEEAFMQELGDDEALRAQYEDELLMQSLLENKVEVEKRTDKSEIFFQPADEHIGMLEKAIGNKDKKAPVVPMFTRYKMLAAASVAIILGTWVIFISTRNKSEHLPIADDDTKTRDISPVTKMPDTVHIVHTVPAETNRPKDSTIQKNNGNNKSLPLPQLADNKKTQQLFDRLNTPYNKDESADDPVQASIALSYYNNRKYGELLATTDASVQEMGANEHEAIAKQYLHFYKGLACLATNKPENATQWLGKVLQAVPATDPLHHKAEWYNTLAYLKLNAIPKAVEMAQKIVKTKSPYKSKAIGLLKDLGAE